MDRSTRGFAALMGGVLLFTLLELHGCGGSAASTGEDAGISPGTGMLRPASSASDLESKFRAAIGDRVVIVSRYAVLLDANQREQVAQMPLAQLLPKSPAAGSRARW